MIVPSWHRKNLGQSPDKEFPLVLIIGRIELMASRLWRRLVLQLGLQLVHSFLDFPHLLLWTLIGALEVNDINEYHRI